MAGSRQARDDNAGLVVQLAVNIVVLAAIYALIACGYVLVYRVSRVLNLAHGELMMLGAYLLLMTATQFSSHWLVAMLAAVLLSLLTGVLVYLFLMRKMTGEMVLAAVLTTVALGILLRGVMVLVWSAQQQYPAQPLQITNYRHRTAGWRAHLALRSAAGAARRRSSTAPCCCSCASDAGACACALPARTRCWQRSAASTCTPSMRWPGASPR